MTNSITEAKTIEEVVEVINESKAGNTTMYAGGTDTRSAEEMAGGYAWNSAEESGYTDDASIEGHLDFLVDCGADFDFSQALKNAISRKNTL